MKSPELEHYERMSRIRRNKHIIGLIGRAMPFALGGGILIAAQLDIPDQTGISGNSAAPDRSGEAYYPNCDAARAAGVAPMRFHEPGYREGLDGDNDGIACEPYRPNRRW